MSGGLRHIIKKVDMDGFEGIKWSWPKQKAYLMYSKVMRNKLTLINTMHKGTHEFTYINK